ncbi:MAG: hypothetical protein ACOY3Y_08505 [Acidobacteriota bacterium]
MMLRTLARVVLVWFVVGIAAPAVGENLYANAEGESHAGGPCQDPDPDGHPCGPVCPCACCPGHRVPPALTSGGPLLGAPLPLHLETRPAEAFHPQDVLRRVFHPPRSA